MDYWIIQSYWNKKERSPLSNLFVSSFQAQTFADNIHSTAGYTYSVRPATWQEREERMFLAGIYEHPVWADEAWWINVAHYFKDFFIHISQRDPSMVAFTEDPRKGEADRQTPTRPGKFLQKFLGAGESGLIEHGPLVGSDPKVTKHQIAFYAAWHQSGKRPPTDDVLGFTDDPDMIVRVYEDGPDSCMMGKGWSPEHHPVRVYAGGGLELAYMLSHEDPNDIIGRALCWPDKGVFGRVYPTPNSNKEQNRYDELMGRLKAKGWRSITEDSTVFEGALLSVVTNRYGEYVMPYLDNEYGVRMIHRNGQQWWQMTHSEDHQDNTDGTMNGHDPDWTCDACEEGFSDDDDSYSVNRAWVSTGPNGQGYGRAEATWCRDCYDNGAFYCDGSDERYNEGTTDKVDADDGNTYEKNWFEANGGWYCEYADAYYFRDAAEPILMGDGVLIHESELADNAFQCLETGVWWPNDYQSHSVPLYHHAFDSLAVHPVEMERVIPDLPEDHEDAVVWATAHVLPFEPIYLPQVSRRRHRRIMTQPLAIPAMLAAA
jgi:hypothetical protein